MPDCFLKQIIKLPVASVYYLPQKFESLILLLMYNLFVYNMDVWQSSHKHLFCNLYSYTFNFKRNTCIVFLIYRIVISKYRQQKSPLLKCILIYCRPVILLGSKYFSNWMMVIYAMTTRSWWPQPVPPSRKYKRLMRPSSDSHDRVKSYWIKQSCSSQYINTGNFWFLFKSTTLKLATIFSHHKLKANKWVCCCFCCCCSSLRRYRIFFDDCCG